MRGHWISQTRKLNKHYQNAAKQEDMIGGAIIENVSMLQSLHMPFLWRTDPLTAERKLKLGLCAFYTFSRVDGNIITSGTSRSIFFNEALIDGFPADNKWVLFDFIPDFKSYIYYGDPETGSRSLVVDTSNEIKFEIDTGKVKITHETLTFRDYAADAIDWYWLVPPQQSERRHVYGNISDFTMSGLCVWINKSQLKYASSTKRYSITSANFKAAFDEVEFDLEFKRTKVSSARLHHETNGITKPFNSKNTQRFDFWNIGKTFDQHGQWNGWALTEGKWSVRDMIGHTPTWSYSYETTDIHGNPKTIWNYYTTYKTPYRNVRDIKLVMPSPPNTSNYQYVLLEGFLTNFAYIPTSIQVNTNAKMPYELDDPQGNTYSTLNDSGYDIVSDKGWTMHKNNLSTQKNICNPSQWTQLMETQNYVYDRNGYINVMRLYTDAYNIYIDNPQVSYE